MKTKKAILIDPTMGKVLDVQIEYRKNHLEEAIAKKLGAREVICSADKDGVFYWDADVVQKAKAGRKVDLFFYIEKKVSEINAENQNQAVLCHGRTIFLPSNNLTADEAKLHVMAALSEPPAKSMFVLDVINRTIKEEPAPSNIVEYMAVEYDVSPYPLLLPTTGDVAYINLETKTEYTKYYLRSDSSKVVVARLSATVSHAYDNPALTLLELEKAVNWHDPDSSFEASSVSLTFSKKLN